MSISGISTNACSGYTAANRCQINQSALSFSQVLYSIKNTEAEKNLLKTISPEDIGGEKMVLAWGCLTTGSKVEVYMPEDFDEENPIYKLMIYDAWGNKTERSTSICELDTSSCDMWDMLAYSSHLSRTGEHEKAADYFSTVSSYYRSSLEDYSYDSFFAVKNWSEVTRDVMQLLYKRASEDAAFYPHYLQCVDFLNFLEGSA